MLLSFVVRALARPNGSFSGTVWAKPRPIQPSFGRCSRAVRAITSRVRSGVASGQACLDCFAAPHAFSKCPSRGV